MHRCMGRLDEVFSLRLGFVSFGGQWQHVRTYWCFNITVAREEVQVNQQPPTNQTFLLASICLRDWVGVGLWEHQSTARFWSIGNRAASCLLRECPLDLGVASSVGMGSRDS